jgi:hypothetical protein
LQSISQECPYSDARGMPSILIVARIFAFALCFCRCGRGLLKYPRQTSCQAKIQLTRYQSKRCRCPTSSARPGRIDIEDKEGSGEFPGRYLLEGILCRNPNRMNTLPLKYAVKSFRIKTLRNIRRDGEERERQPLRFQPPEPQQPLISTHRAGRLRRQWTSS